MAEAIPDMEKIAEREALKQRVESARENIERQMGDMAASTTNAAGEVGLVKSLWNVMQERQGKMRELAWKDLKATAAGALSVIPILGETGTAVNIGKAVTAGGNVVNVERAVRSGELASKAAMAENITDKARILGSRKETWKAFGKSAMRVTHNPLSEIKNAPSAVKDAWDTSWSARDAEKAFRSALVVNPDQVDVTKIGLALDKLEKQGIANKARAEAGKSVGLRIGHELLKRVDPLPDVPQGLVTVAGFADFVLPGANIVPALWQLGHNKIEWAKTYGGMALDMGKVVMNCFDRKLTGMKEPQVARAATAFHHG